MTIQRVSREAKLTFSEGPEESTAATAVLTEVAVSQALTVVEIMLDLGRGRGGDGHEATNCGRWRRLRMVVEGTIVANGPEFRVATEANIAA